MAWVQLFRTAVIIFVSSALLTACAVRKPDGIHPITGFDIHRYTGKWYEIARLDHHFERGLSNVTADYSLREGGGLAVVNRGYNRDSGSWEMAEGRAYFLGDPTTASLKVSFFGPFYGGYHVIVLDQVNYQYSMVCGPDLSYLWILARSPDLDPEVLANLIETAQSMGFPTSQLVFVSHRPVSPIAVDPK